MADVQKVEYVIVTSLKTRSLWPRAVEALQLKYEQKWPGMVRLVEYNTADGVRSCLSSLREHLPSYTCFIEHHSLCSKKFVRDVNELTRELDTSCPYGDTLWGIMTGYVEEDILFALKQPPLVLGRATGNSPQGCSKFQSGVWFSEGEKGVAFRKEKGSDAVQREKCPNDATANFVEELSASRNALEDSGVDFVVTSGHATEKDLQMGYSFRSGCLRCNKGQLYGCPLDSEEHHVIKRNEAPKVLSAAGNCLMAHIADENSMALGWMHSACVVQMSGYIVGTWFGYGGWGVHNYLFSEPGALTFSEAFFANQQALLYTLNSKYGEGQEQNTREYEGLVYDRNNVVFYGDPAWAASLDKESSPPGNYSHSHSQRRAVQNATGWTEWEYHLTTNKPGQWDRPPVFVFPSRAKDVKLVSGKAVLTCRFLLLPLSGQYSAGEHYTVTYQAMNKTE